jgi:hypothetical protein
MTGSRPANTALKRHGEKSMASRFHLSWPRFGLRSLLVLVLLLSVTIAVCTRPFVLVRERRSALTQLQNAHWASAAFDDRTWHKNERRGFVVIQNGNPAARPGWLRRWLGDRCVNEILLDSDSTPPSAELLAHFPEAAVLGPQPASAPR